MARRTGDGFRPAEEPLVDATKRASRSAGGLVAAEPVRKFVLVLEEQLPAIGQLRETDFARRDALRVERGVHLAKEETGRRRLTEAQRMATLGQAVRLARRVLAERRWPGERGTVRPPARRIVPAPADQQAHAQEPRRPQRGHGTKSFGSRESDVRKTRTLARAGSSSAR